jgi:superfamily I DNA and/or RNA helicase
LSYSKKKRQLQEEKEARLNKTPEKETRSVIKQSKAFVRKVSYSYRIRLIDEVSQASSATCWYPVVSSEAAQAFCSAFHHPTSQTQIPKVCQSVCGKCASV